jgi:hypothetical protein
VNAVLPGRARACNAERISGLIPGPDRRRLGRFVMGLLPIREQRPAILSASARKAQAGKSVFNPKMKSGETLSLFGQNCVDLTRDLAEKINKSSVKDCCHESHSFYRCGALARRHCQCSRC